MNRALILIESDTVSKSIFLYLADAKGQEVLAWDEEWGTPWTCRIIGPTPRPRETTIYNLEAHFTK